MKKYDRRALLVESLQNELKKRKMQGVQILLRVTREDGLVIKFTNVDTDAYRAKVKALVNDYHESLALKSETKTTMDYYI